MLIPNGRFSEFLKNWRFPILIALVFLVLRSPALHYPYHQDEWKNVASSATIEGAGKFFAHPPLMQIAFVGAHEFFGTDNFRMFPLLFSVASVFLLYMVVRRRSGEKAANWAIVLFTVSFYGILGSLQPDVDGSILPFLFLLSVYTYDRWIEEIDLSAVGWRKNKWLTLLTVALLIGFLFKLSFVLVVGAITVDYAWRNRKALTLKKVSLTVASLIVFTVVYVALLYLIKFVYPAFDMSIMLGHANQFAEGLGRNWIQIVVQGVKAVFYLSPLLIVPVFFISRETLKKTRVFWIYLVISFIFYFVAFDFSRGALDKYLMFAVAPLSIIAGMILADIFNKDKFIETAKAAKTSILSTLRVPIVIGAILSVALFLINFLPHEVLPLYPKTLWFSRVIHGEWLMLNPFNGGSGPMGFYVSFLFIAISFIVSAALVVTGFLKKQWRLAITVILIMIGVTYNAVFAEEYLFGKINGSAPQALKETVAFIRSSDKVKNVLSYNDMGNQYLSPMGKYAGRIYATPESEAGYKEKFTKHIAQGGQFMVVGIPPLGPESFYGKFFAECDILFETLSGVIAGRAYDCSNNAVLINNI